MGDCSTNCNPCGPSYDAINQLAVQTKSYARQALSAVTTVEEFQSLYLGAKATEPTTDNEGNPLQVGALYFNTTDGQMYVWAGSAWEFFGQSGFYLGPKASDPTTDNEGNPLVAGLLYFNTVSNTMRVYNGTSWQNVSFNETTPFIATGTTEPRNLQDRFSDYYYVADFATGDLAARAAFDARVPLNVLSGQTAKIICNPTTGDDFQAMCLWFAQCNKAEDATFYIELADGGHDVNTYIDLSNTNIPVDLRGSATPPEIQITGISYAPVTGFTYRATVSLSTALPASVEVNSPIGMQNIQGNNDAITANGGQIVETIAANRLSFTFIFYSRKGVPISPTSLSGTAINGVDPNKVICPVAWLRCNSAGWDGSSREGFINLINGARMVIRYIGFSYDGPGQGPTTPSTTDERDILFAKYNGSFYHLFDKVVIAGAGDKCIRLDSGSGAFINRSCIGAAGKADRWIDVASGVTVRLIRTFLGGAKGNAITIGDGSNINIASCAMGGGSSGILLIGAGANLGADVSQLNNFVTGFDAIEGIAAINSCIIDNCTRGVRTQEIEGQIIGTSTFTNNVDDIVKITSTNDTAFYRTGTWTPSFGAVSTPTYTTQSGDYVKIGDIVHCRARINVSAIDNTDSSGVVIVGLPFVPDNFATYSSLVLSIDKINSLLVSLATRGTNISAFISAGSIILTSNASTLRYTDLLTSGDLIISFSYKTTDT